MHRPGLAAVAVLSLALGAGTGCDRKIEAFDPEERPELPNLARIFRPQADPMDEIRGGGPGPQPPPGRGTPGPGADPSADAAPISGTVRVASELADGVPPTAVLFLMARHGEAGPPLAVVRVPSPSFPLDFQIGPGDRMIAEIPFAGAMSLTARLDGDGNATTRQPGDLMGSAAEPASPGATGVVVTLDQRI